MACILLASAALRIAFFDDLADRMDETFFLLVAAAFLVIVLPWERLTSLKAAGVEIALDLPQVIGALKSLGLDRVQDERLRLELSRLQSEIEQIGGSRVLWIDDKPGSLVAMRRLLRAFGVVTVIATSTTQAESVLDSDNDFDLIVSDVQRRAKDEQVTFDWIRKAEPRIKTDRFGEIQTTDGRWFYKLHEGVNYIVRLRTERGRDAVLRSLPVLFYAAYEWPRLAQYTAVAVATSPDTEIANSPATFIPKAIRLLSKARSEEIVLGEEKQPT